MLIIDYLKIPKDLKKKMLPIVPKLKDSHHQSFDIFFPAFHYAYFSYHHIDWNSFFPNFFI